MAPLSSVYCVLNIDETEKQKIAENLIALPCPNAFQTGKPGPPKFKPIKALRSSHCSATLPLNLLIPYLGLGRTFSNFSAKSSLADATTNPIGSV